MKQYNYFSSDIALYLFEVCGNHFKANEFNNFKLIGDYMIFKDMFHADSRSEFAKTIAKALNEHCDYGYNFPYVLDYGMSNGGIYYIYTGVNTNYIHRNVTVGNRRYIEVQMPVHFSIFKRIKNWIVKVVARLHD